jgi:hypothetical protein
LIFEIDLTLARPSTIPVNIEWLFHYNRIKSIPKTADVR